MREYSNITLFPLSAENKNCSLETKSTMPVAIDSSLKHKNTVGSPAFINVFRTHTYIYFNDRFGMNMAPD